MKKLLLALAAAAVASTAHAGGFASVDFDMVKDSKTKASSQAQYVRFGTDVAGLNVGVQARTQVWEKGGMVNSLEATAGKKLGPVNVFGGLGHDNGFNGAAGKSFQYGLVGASTGMPVGPVYAFTGVKARVNWDKTAPEQTLGFVGVSYPVTKAVSVSVSGSKSWRDIKESAVGAGVRVSF